MNKREKKRKLKIWWRGCNNSSRS